VCRNLPQVWTASVFYFEVLLTSWHFPPGCLISIVGDIVRYVWIAVAVTHVMCYRSYGLPVEQELPSSLEEDLLPSPLEEGL